MHNVFRSLIRTSSFLFKEIFEILRQPRLIATLVLGPFLIMLLVGVGYRNEARALRTLFVVPEGSGLAQQVEQYATSLGPQLIFVGTTSNQDGAIQALYQGKVDLVVIAPADAYNTIRNNQQAKFVLYHNEIDPSQVAYVRYFGQIYVDELNRRVLRGITEQSQGVAGNLQENLQATQDSANAMRDALQAGDMATAQGRQKDLSHNLSAVELGVGASLGLLTGVEQTLGNGQQSDAQSLSSALSDLRQNTNALGDTPVDPGSAPARIQRLAQVDRDLEVVQTQLKEFRSIDPQVLVSPFTSDAKGIAPVQPAISDFYAPAVIVLLIQHLCITFASLSFVRDRSLGAMELFRVSPLSSLETLLGKYISYFLFVGVLTAILTALVLLALKVPMLGHWGQYVLAVAALIFTALGLGFVISLVAQTDSQAVQYAMLVLLASVFFSGFLMNLLMLTVPVRVVSWALPATYGILLLQNIMLRGFYAAPLYIGALTAIGLFFFLLSLFLLRGTMRSGR